MPNQMFGAPTGESQAYADIRANKLAEMTLAQGSVALEQAKLNLSSQKQMIEMMNQPGPQAQAQGGKPPPTVSQSFDLSSQMERLSQMALASGMPEKAREYAVAGSTLKNQASAIAKNDLDAQLKHFTLIGSLMAGVHDEASWQRANKIYQMQVGSPTPYAKLPYDPRVVEEIQMGATSAKDRALTSAAQARQQASEAAVAEREARVPLIRAQTKLAEERTTTLKKAGAVTLIPKAGDIKAITDLIVKDYGAGVLPEDARVMARPVAESMVHMIKAEGLAPSVAANRAYQEAKAAGVFGGLRPRLQQSGTPEKPLDIPEDVSKLRPNMFYRGKGKYSKKVLLWTGDHFLPVGNGPGEVSLADENESEVAEETSTDEEEESSNPDDELPAVEP